MSRYIYILFITVLIAMTGMISFYKIRYELARSNLTKCELEREIEQTAILNLHKELESAKLKLIDKSKEIDSRYIALDIDSNNVSDEVGGIDNLSVLNSCNKELDVIESAMRVFYAR